MSIYDLKTLSLSKQLTDITNLITTFGARGDGITDDTAAIQLAVSFAAAQKKTLDFGTGKTYMISSPITIGSSSEWNLSGNGCTIIQKTDNTPIFLLSVGAEPESIYQFGITNFVLKWANAQPATNTNSIAIAFRSTVDNNYGFYNFIVDNIKLVNAFRGLSVYDITKLTMIWGASISNIKYTSSCTGALSYFSCTPNGGQPNNRIVNVYARTDSCTENLIEWKNVNSSVIDNIEVNYVNGKPLVYYNSCSNIVTGTIRFESGSFTTNYRGIIEMASSQGMIFNAIHVYNVTINVANHCWVVRDLTATPFAGSCTVNYVSIQSCTISGGACQVFRSGGGVIVCRERMNKQSTVGVYYLFDNTGLYFNYEYRTPKTISADNGDANITLTADDRAIQYFNTPLTAGRTVTLPTVNLYNGLSFRVVRTAASTGAFTLAVGASKNLNAGQFAEVVYNGSAWVLTDYGSL